MPGPTSGQFIEPVNGRTPPFVGRQPVEGFSALLLGDDGAFLALSDNGFGTQETSPDFLLRVYELRPDFRTRTGGSGTVAVRSLFLLSDPNRLIPFRIVADLDRYPGSEIAVDPEIRSGRLLTGGDFDPESFRRAPDGTFYFGDEFGPFLLHTAVTGVLLEPPISLPAIRSPQHPELGDEAPTLSRSGGFEGMALSADGTTLLPMLEHALAGQGLARNVYAFDLRTGRYAQRHPDSAAYRYRMEPEGIGVTEITWWRGDEYLVIERDDGEGPTARFKKVFLVNPLIRDAEGYLVKTEILDLLAIPDPDEIGRIGPDFRFPFWTPESLVIVDDSTVGIINDNNYPFGQARGDEPDGPDHTELLLIRIRRPSS